MQNRYVDTLHLLAIAILSLVIFAPSMVPAQSVTYSYDKDGRLVLATYDQAITIRYTYDGNNNIVGIATETASPVAAEASAIPIEFALHSNYPNPFNPSSTIRFDVARSVRVVLRVHNILGQEVARLVDETRGPGRYTVIFDADRLPSGLYIYSIEMGDFSMSNRMLLVK